MGTNFYWIVRDGKTPAGEDVGDADESMDPRIHIGKRSSAGRWCWDCEVPLIEGCDTSMIHSGRAKSLDACPCCGQRADGESYNASMVELGFAAPTMTALTGVQGASSFSWAQAPGIVARICREHADEKIITRGGEDYTGAEFLTMLDKGCPIRFTDSIGRWFS